MKSPPFPDKDAAKPPGLSPADSGDADTAGRRFVQRFNASDRATRAVLAVLDARLQALGIDEDDRASAELILAEALNNICEHAYTGQGGPVALIVDIGPVGLDCQLCDRGKPFPGGTLPGNGLPPIDPPDNLPEGGFGWHIIRCLAADLRYGHEDGWNRLSFRIGFAGFD